MTHQAKRSRLVLWMSVTAVLMIAALRIIHIDGPALWTDEGFVYYTFKIPLFDALLADRHPPFYFYSLHAWSALTGDSVFSLRFWSFLPSMLTVALSYQIGRELARINGLDRRGWLALPVLAALIMALMDAENYMAQELRMYTWHTCFAAGTLLGYLRFWRKPDGRNALLWGSMAALGLYTHYFSAFILIVQGLHALAVLRGRHRILAFVVLGSIGAVFAPWLFAVTLRQFAAEEVCINCATSQNLAILLDFRQKWLFGAMWPLALGLALLGLALIRYEGDQWRVTRPNIALTALLLGLIVVPVAGTFELGHEEAVLLARRMVQITVPIAALMALGLANLRSPARGVLVAALIVYGVTTLDWYRIKVAWDEVTAGIADYAQVDELALMEVGFEESALLYYYDHLLPDGMTISSFPVWSDESRFDYYEIALPALLAEQDERQNGVVTAWVTFFSPDSGILDKLTQAGYVRTWTRRHPHLQTEIDVYRYDRFPDAPLADFDNGMRLRAAEVVTDAEGRPERVDLWWMLAPDAEALSREYVVSAFALDASGAMIAQADSLPQMGAFPTTRLTPDDVIYDPHILEPVAGIDTVPSDGYHVAVKVYAFTAAGDIEIVPVNDRDALIVMGFFSPVRES